MSKSSKKRLPKYVVLQKKRGETPLELLNSWKNTYSNVNPEILTVPLSYAGRLDPMAEGKMLVLIGDECKKQVAYTKLDKEYEIEIVLDLKTDTGDVLGLAEYEGKETKMDRRAVAKATARELGPHYRRYPAFSSKTVNGKPLFLYSLENTLSSITIPEHIETMYKISLLDAREVSAHELEKSIFDSLAVVPRSDEPSKELGADFRQDAVRAKWREIFSKFPVSAQDTHTSSRTRNFTILRFRVTCGSGAYMRTLAERIGNSLGTTALALSINRTKIGKYTKFGSTGFWSTKY
jgi:tRNA U55 pseudouridine synthase TruB